jgi:O-acetyl-ADP-ribose deacetylase (regulator of RNase III)
LEACKDLAVVGGSKIRCREGWAELTASYGELKCQYVIHVVPPDFSMNTPEKDDPKRASAFARAFQLAHESGCDTVAFPALGAGDKKGCSDEQAAVVAIAACQAYADITMKRLSPSEMFFIKRIDFVLPSDAMHSTFLRKVEEAKLVRIKVTDQERPRKIQISVKDDLYIRVGGGFNLIEEYLGGDHGARRRNGPDGDGGVFDGGEDAVSAAMRSPQRSPSKTITVHQQSAATRLSTGLKSDKKPSKMMSAR